MYFNRELLFYNEEILKTDEKFHRNIFIDVVTHMGMKNLINIIYCSSYV